MFGGARCHVRVGPGRCSMSGLERDRAGPNKNKIRPIGKSVDVMEKGLPANLDAERYVLGAVLLDGERFSEISTLNPDDFAFRRHGQVFHAMQNLQARDENIDRLTVYEELVRHGEAGGDGLSFLMSLDDGMPPIVHLHSWVRIIRNKSLLRRTLVAAQKVCDECLLETGTPGEILAGHAAQIAALSTGSSDGAKIHRVEDLESVFADRAPVEYLVKPELPAKTVVCLTGDSESGKTTLACAWARDVISQGHAVLILDRDKNPRERIRERLERLGIESDGELLHVWDCEQEDEAPQPDHPIVTDWVKRMMAATGKSPLVIVDSLVSFFAGDEDENSAVDMRALFNRCRALTKLGATVILIHHTNRQGEARGSSDFRPASDQAFLVSNYDRDGGRLLDSITLEAQKSRYGLFGRIRYHYAGGNMLRVEDQTPSKTVTEQLLDMLKANPGILTEPFSELAHEQGLGRNRGRNFLKEGVKNGTIRVQKEGRKHHHFWRGADDLDPQRTLI
jgi:archaellum biogenesis ATPase FlaH